MIVLCSYCNKPAKLITGQELYRHRTDLKHHKFWYCKDCDAYVGCHMNTDQPLGRLADAELRYWKKQAHLAFDPIWKSKKIGRNEAYKRLAKRLGISIKECHISKFDVETCKKVRGICSKYTLNFF